MTPYVILELEAGVTTGDRHQPIPQIPPTGKHGGYFPTFQTALRKGSLTWGTVCGRRGFIYRDCAIVRRSHPEVCERCHE